MKQEDQEFLMNIIGDAYAHAVRIDSPELKRKVHEAVVALALDSVLPQPVRMFVSHEQQRLRTN